MGFNGKHLSLDDRKIIENNIGKGLRKFETAKELNKAPSTIGKELKNNRKRKYHQREDLPFMCNHFKKCKVFTSICKDSREGVNLNTTELFELDYITCPLIKQGQSIYTILEEHPEITQCEKNIYTYIEMGLFKDWGVTNLELRRKVKRKLDKKKLKKKLI